MTCNGHIDSIVIGACHTKYEAGNGRVSWSRMSVQQGIWSLLSWIEQ